MTKIPTKTEYDLLVLADEKGWGEEEFVAAAMNAGYVEVDAREIWATGRVLPYDGENGES